MDGLGKKTSFSIRLSNATAQQFFIHPLGSGGNRIIVRSTDEKRQLAGGLTRPIGEVSQVETCSNKAEYPKSEGISGFVDVVTVSWENVCKHEAACIEERTRKVLGSLSRVLQTRTNVDTLIMPAISTGHGWVSQDVFYTAFADAYSDDSLKTRPSIPNVIFGVFSGDWNGNGGPTSRDQSKAIEGALSLSLQKIAISWKRDADTTVARSDKEVNSPPW